MLGRTTKSSKIILKTRPCNTKVQSTEIFIEKQLSFKTQVQSTEILVHKTEHALNYTTNYLNLDCKFKNLELSEEKFSPMMRKIILDFDTDTLSVEF
jgi:hypothetical protein